MAAPAASLSGQAFERAKHTAYCSWLGLVEFWGEAVHSI
jgi:uncharacterized protein (DUF427 family)